MHDAPYIEMIGSIWKDKCYCVYSASNVVDVLKKEDCEASIARDHFKEV